MAMYSIHVHVYSSILFLNHNQRIYTHVYIVVLFVFLKEKKIGEKKI